MKIKSIKIENNQIFGNIFLDFSLNNKASDTVILAGENGCGKTKILEIIYLFSNFDPPVFEKFLDDRREFIVELNDEEITKLKNTDSNIINEFFNSFNNNEISIKIDYSLKEGTNSIKIIPTLSRKIYKDLDYNDYINIFTLLKQFTKSIYLNTEINFNPKNITSVTAMNLDEKINSSYKTDENLASEITQLLVDIQAVDDSEIAHAYRPNKIIDENTINLRMQRFKNAFDYMFPYKKYKLVRNEEGFKKVIFEEFGKEMAIENLSSGEKQIAYRGSFLLQNKNSNQNCFILIDEPEISLHPVWQLKIIDFYKYLFKNTSGEQTSQLFFATHSPFIIHNINRYDDKIVILNKDKLGNISVKEEPEFYGWTTEKKIENAFNINLKFGIDKPTVYVEGKTDELYILKAIEIFNEIKKEYIDIREIGKADKRGNLMNGGSKGLDSAMLIFTCQPKLIQNKVILLYDSDVNKPDEDIDDKLFIRSIPFNVSNTEYKKGIENLLNIQKDFLSDDFKPKKIKITEYSEKIITEKFDKDKLCNWICNEIKIEKQIKYLEYFKDLIEKIKLILF